jgi:hypothetical protein
MTSVSLVDWKIEPRRISAARSVMALERLPLCATAKPPSASSANKRLDVAQRGLAGGRIADMADRRGRQLADDVVAVEIAGDMAHRAVRMEVGAVEAGDARGFLAAMLERVEAERDEARCALGAPDSENAALFASLSSSNGLVVSMSDARIHLEGLVGGL